MGMLQFIQEIKKAEGKARDIIGNAEIQAAKALEETRMKVAEEIDNQRKASVQMENRAIHRATGEAQHEIERLRKRENKELEDIRKTARENMDKAVRRIMEEMYSSWAYLLWQR